MDSLSILSWCVLWSCVAVGRRSWRLALGSRSFAPACSDSAAREQRHTAHTRQRWTEQFSRRLRLIYSSQAGTRCFSVYIRDALINNRHFTGIATPTAFFHDTPQAPTAVLVCCDHTRARATVPRIRAPRHAPRARACHHLRITQPFSRSRRPGSGRCRSRSRTRARRVPWPRLPESRSSHPPGHACQTA